MIRVTAAVLVLCSAMVLIAQEPEKVPSLWSGNVSIGGEYQYGNTEKTSYTVSAEAARKTDADNYKARILSTYAADDVDTIARNTFLSMKYDRLFTVKMSWYVSEDLLNDEFKNLDLRSTTGAGLSYKFITSEKRSLLVEAGYAYITEDYVTTPGDSYSSARGAASFMSKVGAAAVFTDMLEVFPRLDESTYLLRNEASLTNSLGSGWSMKLSNIVQVDSGPPAGVKKTDVIWIFSLQYSF